MTYFNNPFRPRPFNFQAFILRNQAPLKVIETLSPVKNHDNVRYLHNDNRFVAHREMINTSKPKHLNS